MKRTTLHRHINSILYLEGTTGYTTVYFTDQKPQLYAYPLIRFAETMPTLLRTHRTYLVNPDHVETFRYQGLLEAYVIIREQKLPVSRRRAKAVYSALYSFSTFAGKHRVDRIVINDLVGRQQAAPLGEASAKVIEHHSVNIFDYEDAVVANYKLLLL